MISVFKDDEGIKSIANGEPPKDLKYFEFYELPDEPQESWILSDDGVITIDQEKLIFIKREQMPQLTPMDFDLKLDKYNLYDAVQELISTDRTLSIAYNRALYFSRTDSFIEQARIALNLTHEQIDEMWTS